MTLSPYWLIRIGHKLQQASDWIDAKFFPLPATPSQRKRTEHENVEYCAGLVMNKINACARLSECDDCFDLILEFKSIWGTGTQVRGWFDSLFLALNNKRNEIIKNKYSCLKH